MRRFHFLFAVGALLVTLSASAVAQDSTPAQPTKPKVRADYPLTTKCGPWMVMVKSFQGPQAVDYANRLSRELREKHKIPAYVFVKQPEQSEIQQAGYVRGHVRQYVTAAVLAGDCKNEKTANKLQDQIQNIRPATITDEMVPKYQWDAGPLRTAFCLPNPLGPSGPAKPDPVLTKMNSGPRSVLRCPGPYTLEAALFTGGIAYTKKDAEKLEKCSLLEAAGEHAEQIASQLGQMGYDAYVYHGLTYSLVAVGSFSSPQDPQVEQVSKQLAGMRVLGFTLSPTPKLMRVPER